MLSSSQLYAQEFSAIFHPFGTEYDLERRHPEAVQTLVNLTGYVAHVDELREALRPEMELISSRIIAPVQELEVMLKSISKAITKRDHKLIDFDRHNNSYTKLKEKQNRSAKDDQSMFKLEHECESSAADYEHHNNMLKTELPKFFELATKLITPLFYSFYYMQLNIFYSSMERLQTYAQGKFDMSENNLIAHEHKYSLALQNVTTQLEKFSIQKPVPPSARILQMAKAGQKLSTVTPMTTLQGYPTGAESGFSAAPSKATGAAEPAAVPAATTPAAAAAPPAAPPAYSAAAPEPKGDYVVALYDYTATVRCFVTDPGGWRPHLQGRRSDRGGAAHPEHRGLVDRSAEWRARRVPRVRTRRLTQQLCTRSLNPKQHALVVPQNYADTLRTAEPDLAGDRADVLGRRHVVHEAHRLEP